MPVLLYGAETWTLLVADMNTLEAINIRCQRQVLDVRWWSHVSNAEVLQRPGLSTVGDMLRNRHLSLFGHVALLDPGVPAHYDLRLMVDTKAESQRPAGEDHRAALATSGSTRFRRMPTLYCCVRCGDLRSPVITERRNGHSDYATTTTTTTMIQIQIKSHLFVSVACIARLHSAYP